MAERKWTEDQKKILNSRGQELLVSAAAGSGKTAVLVERIYGRVMDKSHPVDIDRFVVVTFTKAAATEMKDRLKTRIEKALNSPETPAGEKERLRRQLRLIPTANISTVHSFCNFIIGQYFHRIGLDPSYTQGTEEELALIKNRVMDELLEEKYAAPDKSFKRLIDLRAMNRSDDALSTWIYEMYKKSVSEPFPDVAFDEWERKAGLKINDDASEVLAEIILREQSMAGALYNTVIGMAGKYAGVDKKYDTTMDQMKTAAKKLKTIAADFVNDNKTAKVCYGEMMLVLQGLTFDDLAKTVPKITDKEKTDPVKLAAKEKKIKVWKLLDPIRSQFFSDRDEIFFQSLDKHDKDRESMKEALLSLMKLTKEFAEAFRLAKRELGIVDFSDLEQFALQILFDKDEKTGRRTRSEVARELSEYFEEIMIDEYQDSNRIQDTILWSVSKCEEDANLMPWDSFASNRFMVGDIKQSIYRFRNACPELFEEKMKSFSIDDDAPHRRIDLHMNFRSRGIVIDSTNDVFKDIMHEDIGGVSYDKDVYLHQGLKITAPPKGTPVPEKVYLYDVNADFGKTGLTKEGAAAYAIAEKIEEMVHGNKPLYIEDEDGYRRVSYRDIVILTRALKPIAYEYMDVFNHMGIPLVTELNQGFYGSREVSVVLNMLNIVDNPKQDIPLATVLLSPMFGFSEDELGFIKQVKRRSNLYDSMSVYLYLYKLESGEIDTVETEEDKESEEAEAVETGEDKESGNKKLEPDEKLAKKIDVFMTFLKKLRSDASFVPASDITERIYRETGIYDYFACMPDGDRRCANLDYLMHLITEGAAGTMLHDFVVHMSELAETQADMGEAMVHGEGEDVVRLMSVHKSKGLEFPVVILTRTESEGKASDSGRWLYDSEFGVGGFADDIAKGIEKKTLIWYLIHRRNAEDDLGEILRLLYVALTRARDQLILISVNKDEDMSSETDYYHRLRMKSFASMVEPAVAADTSGDMFVREDIDYSDVSKLPAGKVVTQDGEDSDTSEEYNTGIYRADEPEGAPASRRVYPSKVSVSELKLAHMEAEDGEYDGTLQMYEDADEEQADEEEAETAGSRKEASALGKPVFKKRNEEELPPFMRDSKEKAYTAAEKGTITHHIMATIDFTAFDGMDAADEAGWSDKLSAELDLLVDKGYLPEEERHVADEAAIVAFFRNELGQRMIAAAGRGQLHREQPFTLSLPVAEVFPEAKDEPEDTTVLVQGIIDGYFEEDGSIVLMDYKTDKVTKKDGAETLKGRYATQLVWYQKALETTLGENVTEKFLYSFSMKKEVIV